jgi:hypothetical protein
MTEVVVFDIGKLTSSPYGEKTNGGNSALA